MELIVKLCFHKTIKFNFKKNFFYISIVYKNNRKNYFKYNLFNLIFPILKAKFLLILLKLFLMRSFILSLLNIGNTYMNKNCFDNIFMPHKYFDHFLNIFFKKVRLNYFSNEK